MDTATVRSKLKGNKVALFERHPDHPNGEAFVAGNDEVEVALTPFVHKRISAGYIEIVPSKPKAAAKDKGNAKNGPAAPWDGYDDLTVGQVLDKLNDSDKPTRDKILAYERANQKRTGIIEPLVNWNSGKS